jgi:hypothetical protein
MWPAIVVDEALIGNHKGLSKNIGGRSVSVQFFGTHDFARFVVLTSLEFFCAVNHSPICRTSIFLGG